jgi:hypothetical protein
MVPGILPVGITQNESIFSCDSVLRSSRGVICLNRDACKSVQ